MAARKGHKAKTKKKRRLHVGRIMDVPIREVSGICLRRRRRGGMSLFAIGDRMSVAAWVRLPRRDTEALRWRTVDIARLPGSRLPDGDSQLEAVCADGAGRVLIVQEAPPRAELVDLAAAEVVATITLEVPGRNKLARSWSDPKGSRGEGAVFLRGGHLLVAKEKDPPAFIEFGPPGARSRGLLRGTALAGGARWKVEPGHHRYVALAVWWPDRRLEKACADLSDLEVGPDGRLYVLSDQSESIARLGDLPPGGGIAERAASWRIRGLDGKPEGLAFTTRGRAIVALDTPRARDNLVLLKPAIAAR